MNWWRKSLLVVGLAALVAGTPGCGFINKLRAKDSLNEGVREFNKGRFDLAREKFQRALDLAPDLTNAQLYYARSVNALFDQNLTEGLGRDTIAAYETIIQKNQNNPKAVDQAYAFEAKVYEQMARMTPDKADSYKQKARESLLKRADLSGEAATKAAVFYTIGQGYWQESYDLSRPYLKLVGASQQQLPIPANVSDKMKPIITKGHEYLQKAISIKADYADAWIYEKLIYIEERKIESNPQRKTDIDKQIDVSDKNYKKFHEQQAAAAGGQSGT